MNAKTWRNLLPKQTSDDNNKYYGGFDDDGLVSGWSIIRRYSPNMKMNSCTWLVKSRCCCQCLSARMAMMILGNVLCNVLSKTQLWKVLLMKFYEERSGDEVWKVLSVDWLLESKIVDFRFFHQDDKVGFCATSEIVLRLLYRVWSKKAADDTLLKRWHSLVVTPRNRCSLVFDVEEIIKAQICCFGVTGTTYSRPKDGIVNRYRFQPGTEQSTLDRAIKESTANSWWILVDPHMFNYHHRDGDYWH